jgi:hypothetical protein
MRAQDPRDRDNAKPLNAIDMDVIFSPDFAYIWAVVLGIALFFPVRNLIYVRYVRRAMRKLKTELPQEEMARLRQRAGVTAGLVCFVFAILYTGYLFNR